MRHKDVSKNVRTTIDLPEQMLVDLKIESARRRTPVKNLVQEAISRYLVEQRPTEPAWMKSFGAFKDDAEEVNRIQAVIDEEFSKVDPEEWK